MPSYSPHLNKIENYWAILKEKIKNIFFSQDISLFNSINEAFNLFVDGEFEFLKLTCKKTKYQEITIHP